MFYVSVELCEVGYLFQVSYSILNKQMATYSILNK